MVRSCGPLRTAGLLLVLVTSSCICAGELTDQIKQTTDQILSILQDPALRDPNKTAERRRQVMKIVDERFDWEIMARSAMGTHWRGLTPAQQKEFTSVFSQLVEQTYMTRVENYSGEKILYKGDKVSGRYGVADVVIVTLKGTEIPVGYRVVRKNQKWMVYDVTIEGVSLINNYRSQIGAVLDKSSFADLMKRIRATLARGDLASEDPNTSLNAPQHPAKG
jgi:phospholipid transport system substrate-binding protein